MTVTFVNVRNGETVLTEPRWDLAPPREGDVMELHSGRMERWVVEEVDWVFEDVPEGTHHDVPVKGLKVMVIREEEVTHGEHGEVLHHDPICVCGHAKSMHAPSRCLGNGSTCQCHGFTPKA